MDVSTSPARGAALAAAPVADDGYKWKVLASVVVGLFMVILDATVVNVALRALQEKYAAATSDVQWVISLYTLALGIATPLSGFLGDRVGVKRVYIAGLAIFVLGSVLCGLAPSLPLLIAARGLQGLGGGIALPLGTAMLFGAFPPEQRGAAFGVFGIVLVFAPASGPLLGGWLVDHKLIPWIFFINLPIGLLGLTVSGQFLRGGRGRRAARADLAGIILAPTGFGALLFAASIAGQPGAGWTDGRVLAGLGAGIALLAALVVAELRAADPLLDLRLYRLRGFALGSAVGLIGTVALFGAEFLLPLYLQILRGRTAFEAGLFLLPLAIASGVVIPLSGVLTDRIGPRVPIVAGFVLLAFNTYQLSKITLATSLAYITLLVVLRGIGIALVVQNAQVAALADVPPTRLTRATPLYGATLMYGERSPVPGGRGAPTPLRLRGEVNGRFTLIDALDGMPKLVEGAPPACRLGGKRVAVRLTLPDADGRVDAILACAQPFVMHPLSSRVRESHG